MPVQLNPETVHPGRGKLLVEITEQLGGLTKGGIFISAALADTDRKDLAMGRVVRMGALPKTKHSDRALRTIRGEFTPNESCQEWKSFPVSVGDLVCFPRDVPLVITWKEKRYAIVLMQELQWYIDGDKIDDAEVQTPTWWS